MKRREAKTTKWRMYSDLAWTELILSPPEEYVEETELFCKAIREHSNINVETLLHLGCGAGINDYTFKRYFKVTGVDISENMLEIAKKINPEVVYIHGDMRTVKLGECFDAVAIPDSICHMRTMKDLKKAVITAYKHLKPGGVLLIVDNIAEEFKPNNFVYTGSQGDIEITIFENDYILHPTRTAYEVTIIYLIRRKGKLKIYTDRGLVSLFKRHSWLELFRKVGFEVKNIIRLEGLYDRSIVGGGEYPLQMFVCTKPL